MSNQEECLGKIIGYESSGITQYLDKIGYHDVYAIIILGAPFTRCDVSSCFNAQIVIVNICCKVLQDLFKE